MIGQFIDIMILALTDTEWLINDPSNSKSWKVLETVSSPLRSPKIAQSRFKLCRLNVPEYAWERILKCSGGKKQSETGRSDCSFNFFVCKFWFLSLTEMLASLIKKNKFSIDCSSSFKLNNRYLYRMSLLL